MFPSQNLGDVRPRGFNAGLTHRTGRLLSAPFESELLRNFFIRDDGDRIDWMVGRRPFRFEERPVPQPQPKKRAVPVQIRDDPHESQGLGLLNETADLLIATGFATSRSAKTRTAGITGATLFVTDANVTLTRITTASTKRR